MSRVGSSPVVIPDGTDIQVSGQLISAKGKQGEMSVKISPEIEIL